MNDMLMFKIVRRPKFDFVQTYLRFENTSHSNLPFVLKYPPSEIIITAA